ncbi:MAG: GIDE domain-containing protein [Candidatus Omnitrophota bacterium]
MSDDRDILYAVMGCGFGVWFFFRGFNRLRRKRLIENIPTSTIRGLAMGLVELYGKAEKTPPLKSPFTKTECVLYKYLIEEYRKSGKSGHWVSIASGDSFYSPFRLDDGTGRIMVFPQHAELIMPVDNEFRTGIVNRSLPEAAIDFMETNGIRYKNWLGMRTLRFKEWLIRPGEMVYVLGSAKKDDYYHSDYKKELIRRLEDLKVNAEKMKEVDLNKDGAVSTEEWDTAVAKVEQELLAETLRDGSFGNPADVVIGKSDTEDVFMISDHGEKGLIKRLSMECVMGIYGGAALSLATFAYLLFRLRFLWS